MTDVVRERREESILKESSSLTSPKISTWILQQHIDLVKCHSPKAYLLPSRCGVDLTYPVLVDKKDIASVRLPCPPLWRTNWWMNRRYPLSWLVLSMSGNWHHLVWTNVAESSKYRHFRHFDFVWLPLHRCLVPLEVSHGISHISILLR